MGRDQYGPPAGLSEEELRRWQQWRKFVWLPGDIKIIKPDERSEDRGEEAHEGRDDEQPGGAGAREEE